MTGPEPSAHWLPSPAEAIRFRCPLQRPRVRQILQALLTAAKVPGPYVLVGHSMGGMIARLVASEDGDEVAGLVLEDALSEDLYSGLTPDQRAVFEKLNGAPENYDNAKKSRRFGPPRWFGRCLSSCSLAGLPQLTPEVIASGQLPPEVTQAFADALGRRRCRRKTILLLSFLVAGTSWSRTARTTSTSISRRW